MQLPPVVRVDRQGAHTPLCIAKEYALRLVASDAWHLQRRMATAMRRAMLDRLDFINASPDVRALVCERVFKLAEKLQGVLDRFAIETPSVNAPRHPRRRRRRRA